MITGIGDEVLLVLGTLFLALIISVVWISTHVQERPPVQAILLQPVNGSGTEAVGHLVELPGTPVDSPVGDPRTSNNAETEESVVLERQSEEPVDESNDDEEKEETSERPINTSAPHTSTVPEPEEEENVTDDNVDAVTIKLKFLNDTFKEVQAPLTEKIGQFKERHFADDMANNKLIRLIFNGQILNHDTQTLSQCGLFDNCVVHCLIHQRQAPHHQAANNPQPAHNPVGADEGDLDLSHICYPLLGGVLITIWCFQIAYSHYFNFTSTVSLVSLSVLFLASFANTYFY